MPWGRYTPAYGAVRVFGHGSGLHRTISELSAPSMPRACRPGPARRLRSAPPAEGCPPPAGRWVAPRRGRAAASVPPPAGAPVPGPPRVPPPPPPAPSPASPSPAGPARFARLRGRFGGRCGGLPCPVRPVAPLPRRGRTRAESSASPAGVTEASHPSPAATPLFGCIPSGPQMCFPVCQPIQYVVVPWETPCGPRVAPVEALRWRIIE